MDSSALQSNILMLQIVAAKLKDLCNELVFVGGSITGLLITEPHVPDVRSTLDVDCIVSTMSILEYHKVQNRLRKLGFKESKDLICRWVFDEIILDVMPTDENILGFSNIWYKDAVNTCMQYILPNKVAIQVVNAPYLLATKFEAFKDRGQNNYLSSHDLEDIITILDGRAEIADEVINSKEDLRTYLRNAFQKLLNDRNFIDVLPGHLNQYGIACHKRVEIVLERINFILSSIK